LSPAPARAWRQPARGRVGGRPSVMTPEIIRAARAMQPNPDTSITSIAKLLGVSPGALYNHIPDLIELRSSRVPKQLGGGGRWSNQCKNGSCAGSVGMIR